MQASTSPQDDAIDLRDYLGVLRRRIWLLIPVIVVFVALAGAYTFTRKPLYTATSEVLVQPTSVSTQYRPDQLVSLDTEARLARSAPVAEMAKEALGWPLTIQQLVKRVKVVSPAEALVLDISFTDLDAPDAAAGANAFADAYLEYKRERAVEAATAARQGIQARIDDLLVQRDKLDRQIAEAVPGSLEAINAQEERDTVNGQIAVLTSEIASLPVPLDPGEVIGMAETPTSPSSPNHPVNIAMGLFFGVFLGIVAVFVRDRTDERISGRTDLDLTLDAPVLAAIPKVAGWSKKGPVWLVTEQQPRSPAAEAYRTLRTGIMAMGRQRDLKVFGVTSPLLGEGKTTTTANLGAALSHADKRVLVISADLRRPSLYRFFNLDNSIGLADVLLGEVPFEEAVKQISDDLWILTSGRPPVRPAELLQSRRMSEIIERQRDRFDFVLIDCPPVIGLADTLAIAPIVDAMIMVASADVSKRGALMHAVDQLGQVGATVRAGVLNNVVISRRKGTYGYGYGYGYGAADGDEVAAPRSRQGHADGAIQTNGSHAVPTHVPEDLSDGAAITPNEPAHPEQAAVRRDQ